MSDVLNNFRKKYPEYNDMSDVDLATKLASKYPEYSDVLTEVKSKTSSTYEDMIPEKFRGSISAAPKPSLKGAIRKELLGGVFGNLFLRNNPDPELEKRRALLASMANTATLGAPQAVAQYGLGGNLAPVKAPMQEAIGGALGMATPMGISGAASGLVKGAGLGAKVARGMVGGGTFGALLPGKVEERATKGAWGAGIGAAFSLLSAVPKLLNLGGRKTAQAIAEKSDKGINKLGQTLSDKYDDFFAKVKGDTPVDDILQTVDDAKASFPEGTNVGKLKQISKRLSTLQKKGENISAKELHNLKQEVRKLIPNSVWQGKADANAIQNAQENIYWKITEKLEGLGGDKYKGLTTEYKNFKQAERLARKMFYRQGIPSNVPLKGTYDIPTQKAVRGLSEQLPSKEQFAQEFEAWRRGQGLKRMGGVAVGGGALAYALHRYLTDRLLSRER
jgi:hypothetical protein